MKNEYVYCATCGSDSPIKFEDIMEHFKRKIDYNKKSFAELVQNENVRFYKHNWWETQKCK